MPAAPGRGGAGRALNPVARLVKQAGTDPAGVSVPAAGTAVPTWTPEREADAARAPEQVGRDRGPVATCGAWRRALGGGAQ